MDSGDDYSDCGDYDVDYYDDSYHFEPETTNADPESVDYQCLTVAEVETLINNEVAKLCDAIPSFVPSHAKLVLCLNNWDIARIQEEYTQDPARFLEKNGLKTIEKTAKSDIPTSSSSSLLSTKRPRISPKSKSQPVEIEAKSSENECGVCCEQNESLSTLICGHPFCDECWIAYMRTQVDDGNSIRIECMQQHCQLYCTEDFVAKIIPNTPDVRDKYERNCFREFIQSNPYLRFCPGVNCQMISYCKSDKPHRCICTKCETSYCIKCGQDYHAPATCDILKKWQVKCADDSETANYISAHTKDCPNCHACIEKNGGCNHMQCTKCKHHFCWMCFRDWKSHGSEYYECSRYRENPAIAQEANHLKARRALEKYLHYFERFENHSKSLKMEEDLRNKIKAKIDEKVANHEGTWIDWQYLHDAASLLTKCRYTLQYTYPFAYYMDGDPRKELFQYQQAQLEKEIEELSWKVERAETTDRGDLENQMHVAEQKRRTLLQDFFN
ncbi:unnamed protein product [Bursaphelenchus xylophilus]|nr:unnamed protein product [Bursaphelenchus xylophilus]CAG9113788.1 unnamed protein product [Bursaphelenchus xylophilus]